MSMRPTVHLVEVCGILYIGLPGEKKTFREELTAFAAPFQERCYRTSVNMKRRVENLIANHYPDWELKQWGWRTWSEIPPWVRLGVNGVASEAYAGLIAEQGAQVVAEPQRDGSLHLHAQQGRNRVCFVFDEGMFLHACLSHHGGPRAHLESALDYLMTGTYTFAWEGQ